MMQKVYYLINKEPFKINNDTMINTIIQINKILLEHKIKKTCDLEDKTNKNHKWVTIKLTSIVKDYYVSNIDKFTDLQSLSDLKIVDIGGGEGNIISWLGESLDIPKSNIYCVENKLSWDESYEFTNNINYIFWDNLNIDIKPNSIDIIIMIVSIHHMTNTTINNLMLNLKKILKPNGLIIIKEHDSNNNTVKRIIDYEHHLYHILMTPNYDLDKNKLKIYLDNFTNNYMSMKYTEHIFKENGFNHIQTLNRMFKPYIKHDDLDSTNLYWAIYNKS